jgi:NitT/TauT family transport system substrate-binding protein
MKIKLFPILLQTIFIATALTACAPAQPVEEPSPQILRVGFTEWWGDYTLLVAKEKGLFEQYGVQVEPVYYEMYSDYTVDLASGQMDGGFLAMGDTININQITPMKVIAINDDGGADAIVASPEIETIRDLQGKTVGVLIGTQYELMISEMLRSSALGNNDVTIVEVNPEEALTALNEGRVQAVYIWEPYLSEATAAGYKIIYPYEKIRLFPDVIVFRRSIVEERPDEIKAFLRAWFQAVEYRMQREGETRDITAQYIGVSPEEIEPDNNLKLLTLQDNKIFFDIQGKNSIYAVTNITSDYLISIGAVTQETDLLELLDSDFLP